MYVCHTNKYLIIRLDAKRRKKLGRQSEAKREKKERLNTFPGRVIARRNRFFDDLLVRYQRRNRGKRIKKKQEQKIVGRKSGQYPFGSND